MPATRDPATADDRWGAVRPRRDDRFTGIRSTWGDGLLIAIAGLMLLYWTYVPLHLLDTSDAEHVPLAWVDALSGVAAVVVLVLLLVLRPDRGGRLLLTALLSIAAGANAVAHLWLTQDLTSTVLVIIVLMVVAAGITSSPVAAGLVVALWAGWFVAAAGMADDPAWTRHVSDLAVATLAGLMLHVGRRMTMLKLLRAQAELERLSERDDLTGLANRRGFFAVMRSTLAVAEAGGDRLVVLYCDVDGLKLVNDTRGHEAGDMLLIDVAARLRAEFTDAQVVARLGGDEFGVVLLVGPAAGPGAAADAATRAQRIRDDAAESVWSLSVGAASSDELHRPGPRDDPATTALPHPPDLVGAVVGLADERMYQAKRLRPGRHHG